MLMAQAGTRYYYLMSNGKIFAIWETDPAAFLALQKHKPQFKLIMKYSTRAQAEAERQKLQNSK
jgi:1,4-alpha-glucan branching enzyme